MQFTQYFRISLYINTVFPDENKVMKSLTICISSSQLIIVLLFSVTEGLCLLRFVYCVKFTSSTRSGPVLLNLNRFVEFKLLKLLKELGQTSIYVCNWTGVRQISIVKVNFYRLHFTKLWEPLHCSNVSLEPVVISYVQVVSKYVYYYFTVTAQQGPGTVVVHPAGQDVELLCTVMRCDGVAWLINYMEWLPYTMANIITNNLIVENIMMNDVRNNTEYRCYYYENNT